MNVKNIAEPSPWSILQYFWPALKVLWTFKNIFETLHDLIDIN